MLKRQHVVVGVSRTPPGEAALRWALGIGLAQGWEVVAVHAFDVGVRSDVALEHSRADAARSASHRAQAWVQEIADSDSERQLLTFRSGVGDIEDQLVDQAIGATLLVMGEPTTDSHEALPENLRRRCSCPVVVVGASGTAAVEAADGDREAARIVG